MNKFSFVQVLTYCTIEEMENAINQVFKDKEGKWITNYEPEA